MWRPKRNFSLIDLNNEFFIVKFTQRSNHDIALLNGPWMIGEHYLHVQRWVPNFMADRANQITTRLGAFLSTFR